MIPIHKNITWSFDLMVIRVFADKDEILQNRAVVNDYGFSPPTKQYPNLERPEIPGSEGADQPVDGDTGNKSGRHGKLL